MYEKSSIIEQLSSCTTYAKYLLKREIEQIYYDIVVIQDKRARPQKAPLPAWVQPNIQSILKEALAVRVGILVVRNVTSGLQNGARAPVVSKDRIKCALSSVVVSRPMRELTVRLGQLAYRPPTQDILPTATPGTRPAPMTDSASSALERDIVEAGRKRFLGYGAMERAKRLNAPRIGRRGRHLPYRLNRT